MGRKEYTKDINARMHEVVAVINVTDGIQSFATNKNVRGYMFKAGQKHRIGIGDLYEIANMTRLLCGSDGEGTDAMLYIEDAQVREELGYDRYDGDRLIPQKTFSKEYIIKQLGHKSMDVFKKFVDKHSGDVYKRSVIYKAIQKMPSITQDRLQYLKGKYRYE